jgi:hypothetical protein
VLVLGYSGHRRHGWKGNAERKLASRLRHASRHPTLFEALTSFGEEPEDLPLNLFPIDGVGHDSAAAILRFGTVFAAAAEERFTRFKHATRPGGDTMPPRRASAFCLTQAGATIDAVGHVAFYCDFTAHGCNNVSTPSGHTSLRPWQSGCSQPIAKSMKAQYRMTASKRRLKRYSKVGQKPRFISFHIILLTPHAPFTHRATQRAVSSPSTASARNRVLSSP